MSWWTTCPECRRQLGVVRQLGITDDDEPDPIVETVEFDDNGDEIARARTVHCPCGFDLSYGQQTKAHDAQGYDGR